MSAIVLAVIGLVAIFLGYQFYSKFIAEKIYRLDPDFETPAHTMRDDVDYIPTHRVVLWGHHFTAVRGCGADHRAGHRRHLGVATGVHLGHRRHGVLCRRTRFRRHLGERS